MMKEDFNWNFTGRTAVISAGASGIGRGIVRRLLRSGANVVFGDIDAKAGHALLAELQAEQGTVRFVETDFASPHAWKDLLKECVDNQWTPSIGIANAGIAVHAPVTEISIDDYIKVESVNQRSGFLMAQALVPIMRRHKMEGILLFTGSIMSEFGTPDYSLYGMTKSALTGLTRSLAVELAPDGIRVNCIQPGYILGELPSEILHEVPSPLRKLCSEVFGEEFKRAFSNLQPLPLAALDDDVAQLICFLISESSRFITGSTLRIDGGLSVKFPFTRRSPLLPDNLLSEIREWVSARTQ